MIRISNVVKKEAIFDLLNDTRIFKISINRIKTNKLKDKTLCYVEIYVGPHPRINEDGVPYFININTIFAKILEHAEDKLTGGSKPFLKGIRTQKQLGYFTSSQIIKLKVIEKDNDLDFNIPSEFLELINTFKNLEDGIYSSN